MIKKIIHFSDLHVRLFKDHDNYRQILIPTFDEWRAATPNRIIFTGDLVHSKNQMTPELVQMVTWILEECSKICKTIIIPGNHDFIENNLSRLDALTPIVEAMGNKNIVYYKESGVYPDDNVDWVVFSLMSGNVPPKVIDDGRLKLGLFHGPVKGLRTDVGYKFESGAEVNDFDGCDFVFCGDIHKRQFFKTAKGTAFMIGSMIMQNFGEKVSGHGYGIFEVDSGKYTTVDLPNKKPFLRFRIDSIEDIENGTEKLVNA